MSKTNFSRSVQNIELSLNLVSVRAANSQALFESSSSSNPVTFAELILFIFLKLHIYLPITRKRSMRCTSLLRRCQPSVLKL